MVKVSLLWALGLSLVMALVIFFCRAFPFLFFKQKPSSGRFMSFVEKAAPPVAMTVLTLNAIAGSIRDNLGLSGPILIASGFCAAVHLWKRNPLLSILGATALYMALIRIM